MLPTSVALPFLLMILSVRTGERTLTAPLTYVFRLDPTYVTCDHECIVGGLRLVGRGFVLGQKVELSRGKLLGVQLLSPTELLLSLSFDAMNYFPGVTSIYIRDKDGRRAVGTATLLFVPAFNNLVLVGNECFSLDQGVGVVWVADCPAHGPAFHGKEVTIMAKRGCSVGASLAYGLAVDNTTGLIVVTKSVGVILMRKDDCVIIQVLPLGGASGVSARDGLACIVRTEVGLSCIDLRKFASPLARE
jgi:hypothetical protein